MTVSATPNVSPVHGGLAAPVNRLTAADAAAWSALPTIDVVIPMSHMWLMPYLRDCVRGLQWQSYPQERINIIVGEAGYVRSRIGSIRDATWCNVALQ